MLPEITLNVESYVLTVSKETVSKWQIQNKKIKIIIKPLHSAQNLPTPKKKKLDCKTVVSVDETEYWCKDFVNWLHVAYWICIGNNKIK